MARRIFVLAMAAVMALAGAAKTKVACIGDSITYGYGLAARDVESYPAQLQALLDARFPGKYEVRNFGNSGRGVYLDSMRGRERRGFRHVPEHKAALEWKPDVVVCNLGINDNGEYIKEFTGGRKRGQFVEDYCALLDDYRKACNPKIAIWTKLSPLIRGQRFHRSCEPFIMQEDLVRIARRFGATEIDMASPLRERMDRIFAKDKIHPDREGASIIAKATFEALTAERSPTGLEKEFLPPVKSCKGVEYWICAGQSNMQWGWGAFCRTAEEKARARAEMSRLDGVDVAMWDFNDGAWRVLDSGNGMCKSAFAVSFAIRRAEETGKSVRILYVAAGGAPTESFLSEAVMCGVDGKGRPRYPHLSAIATDRHRLDANGDFPCVWVAREYPRRRGNREEAYWWPVSAMYEAGIRKIHESQLPLTGVLWYQGESNATANVSPDVPLDRAYQEETLHAAIGQLRGGRDIPFVMMGLPAINRPWAQYREVQCKVAAERGAIFVDTFAAGLGDPNDVHPRNKIPFAELALKALKR